MLEVDCEESTAEPLDVESGAGDSADSEAVAAVSISSEIGSLEGVLEDDVSGAVEEVDVAIDPVGLVFAIEWRPEP